MLQRLVRKTVNFPVFLIRGISQALLLSHRGENQNFVQTRSGIVAAAVT